MCLAPRGKSCIGVETDSIKTQWSKLDVYSKAKRCFRSKTTGSRQIGETMLSEIENQIDRILAVVAKCPEKLQEQCFVILLEACITSQSNTSPSQTEGREREVSSGAKRPAPSGEDVALPEALRSRFTAMATRIKAPVGRLVGLFDFHLDPYNYHALSVAGASKADKSRNVALLLCAKSYMLSLGDWTADWKEFRAVCLDHGCWDKANAGTYLKGPLFKRGSASEGIASSPQGISAAEGLIAQLCGVGASE